MVLQKYTFMRHLHVDEISHDISLTYYSQIVEQEEQGRIEAHTKMYK